MSGLMCWQPQSIRELVFTSIRAFCKAGVPPRMRRLIVQLATEEFAGKVVTFPSIEEFCDRLTKAIEPWKTSS